MSVFETAGLYVVSLAVIKSKHHRGKLVFRYGERTFTQIDMTAFGFDHDGAKVPMLVFRRGRYLETLFAEYVGGHIDSPVICRGEYNSVCIGRRLIASDFKQGDVIIMAGNSKLPNSEELAFFTGKKAQPA